MKHSKTKNPTLFPIPECFVLSVKINQMHTVLPLRTKDLDKKMHLEGLAESLRLQNTLCVTTANVKGDALAMCELSRCQKYKNIKKRSFNLVHFKMVQMA